MGSWLLAACIRCHPGSPSAPPLPTSNVNALSDERESPPYLPEGCIPGTHDVRSWRRLAPAAISFEQESSLNYSGCTWSVSMRDGVPTAGEHVAPALELATTFPIPERSNWPPRVARQGRAGVLVGYNHGEWGGSLVWFSTDGSPRGELLDDNVVAILPNSNGFLVLAGLSHLGHDGGRALEVMDEVDGFHRSRITELGSAPMAAVIEPTGGALIVTTRGLVRLTPQFHVHRLLESHWRMSYPVSIVIDQARGATTAYVGMRGIVAEINLDRDPPKETWLFPI